MSKILRILSLAVLCGGGHVLARPQHLPQLPSNDVNEVQFDDDPATLLDISPALRNDIENAKNKLLVILTTMLPYSVLLEPPTVGMSNISLPLDNSTIINLSRLQLTVDIQPKYLKVVPDLRLLSLGFEYYDASVNIIGNYRMLNEDLALVEVAGKGLINITLSNVKVAGVAGLRVVDNALSVHHCDVKYALDDYSVEQKYKDSRRIVRTRYMPTDAFKMFLPGLIRKEVTELTSELSKAQLNSILSDIKLPLIFQGNQRAVRSFSSYAQNVVPYFNEILDEILENLDVQFHNRGLDTYSIPDFNETFPVKESVLRFNLSIAVRNGTFKNISTVYRTSDAALGRNGSDLFLSGGLGLHAFQINYTHYEADFGGLKSQGSLIASIKNTSVLFKIVLHFEHQKCYPSLQYFHVNRFDGLDLELTGSEAFKVAVKPIVVWAFEKYRDQIVNKIEEEVQDLAHKYLTEENCTKYFPPSIL